MQPVETIQSPPPPPLHRRRWVREVGAAVLGLVLVAFLVPTAYDAWWRAHNPAPLGRSARAVDSALARALPVGTPRDSAAAFLARRGVAVSIDSGPGGREILGRSGAVNSLEWTRVDIHLAFDPTWRLTSRAVTEVYTGP